MPRKAAILLVAGLLGAFGFAPSAGATDWPVTKQADTNDGVCNGDCSLREAVVAANASVAGGDNVIVPAGTYSLTLGQLMVSKSMTVRGTAGAPSTRMVAGTAARVFDVATGLAVTFQGLTVSGGNIALPSGFDGGGGIRSAATLTILDSVITGNTVTATGGLPQGGGILSSGPLKVIDSTVSDNHAKVTGSGSIADGGGIASTGGGVDLTRTTFTANTAELASGGGISAGGGLYAVSGAVTVTDSSFTGNQVINGAIPEGGGMFVVSGSLNLTRSTVADNLAEAKVDGATIPEAGGVMSLNGPTTVVDSTISGNRAVDSTPDGQATAGGLFIGGDGQPLSIVNSTVSGNRAEAVGVTRGGGLLVSGNGATTLDLRNTTMAGNAALGPGEGGAIFRSGGTITPRNTLFSGNQAPTGAACSGGGVSSAGHNLESTDTCGLNAAGDLRNTDPQLGPLAANGGPTQTHAIPVTSPAIDAGDSTGCPAADQRGVARSLGGGCDIGAFELPYADLAVTQTATPSTVTSGLRGTFMVHVVNRGPAPSPGTVVDETVPAGVTLLSATPTQGGCSPRPPVTCQLGTLAPGQAADVALVVRTGTLGRFTAEAHATGGEPERTPADTRASAAVEVATADLSLTRARFRLGSLLPRLTRAAPTGTTIRFTLSQAATARLGFQRATPGRRVGRSCLPNSRARRRRPRCTRFVPAVATAPGRTVGRRCLAPTRSRRKRPRCTRRVPAGTLALRAHAGLNRVRFQGRLSAQRTLLPGGYRMTMVATTATGDRTIQSVSFTLLPAPRR